MSTPYQKALGLLEARGQIAGIQALDAAAKGASVDDAIGMSLCPGKFLLFLTGSVSAVETALANSSALPGLVRVASHLFPAVHPSLWPALTGSHEVYPVGGMMIIETYNATTTLAVADRIAKGASVSLLRIRLSSGLGGRGLVFCSGEAANLDSAAALAKTTAGSQLTACRVITAPHPRLWELAL